MNATIGLFEAKRVAPKTVATVVLSVKSKELRASRIEIQHTLVDFTDIVFPV